MIPAAARARLRKNTLGLAAIKLLLLLAFLLLPIGMTHATLVVHHNDTSAAMTQHCPEQGSKGDARAEVVGCAMVCSAVLPAGDIRYEKQILLTHARMTPAIARILRGLHAETATPPPKHA